MTSAPDPVPDSTDADPADPSLTTAEVGQATTAEEAMDALTDEEGFADESAYTAPADAPSTDESTDRVGPPPRRA